LLEIDLLTTLAAGHHFVDGRVAHLVAANVLHRVERSRRRAGSSLRSGNLSQPTVAQPRIANGAGIADGRTKLTGRQLRL
jgi:hypothetical protein